MNSFIYRCNWVSPCKYYALRKLVRNVFRLQGGSIVLVAISVYTLYDKSFIKELLGTNLFTGAVYILIVTGVLLSFLSFLGCAGAVKEVKCMLLTV